MPRSALGPGPDGWGLAPALQPAQQHAVNQIVLASKPRGTDPATVKGAQGLLNLRCGKTPSWTTNRRRNGSGSFHAPQFAHPKHAWLYGAYPPLTIKKVHERKPSEEFRIALLGRALPAVNTKQGVRAVIKSKPIEPDGVERYLEGKFGDALSKARKAMKELANALKPDELAQRGFGLYEQFRPAIPEGVQGWGAKGELDLGRISKLADQTH